MLGRRISPTRAERVALISLVVLAIFRSKRYIHGRCAYRFPSRQRVDGLPHGAQRAPLRCRYFVSCSARLRCWLDLEVSGRRTDPLLLAAGQVLASVPGYVAHSRSARYCGACGTAFPCIAFSFVLPLCVTRFLAPLRFYATILSCSITM